jgi:hypothetical protein
MTHFILCLDTASVRSTRRNIAQASPGLGVVVGTWGDLLRLASSSWLLPPVQSDWQQQLEDEMARLWKLFRRYPIPRAVPCSTGRKDSV